MRRRVERTRKYDRFVRLFSGLFVGGVLMFQGTGFITSGVQAADPTAKNIDVTSLETAANLSDSAYNYGLYGSPLSQSVYIYNGVSAVVGELENGSESLNPKSGVTMTLDSGKTVNIGLNQEGESSQGVLMITGPWGGTTDSSKLTVSSGSAVQVGSKGYLSVGDHDSAKGEGMGALTVNSGASLVNDGTGDYGVFVNKSGSLVFGDSADKTILTDFYSGNGRLVNYGAVRVYNGTSGSDVFTVADYADYDSTLGTGTLTVTGDASLGSSSAMKLHGTLSVSGNADFSSDASAIEWTSDSKITIGGIAEIFEDDSNGANLTIGSKSASADGLWVKRAANAGGALTIDKSAVLTVNGLDEKFAKDGTRSEDGLYDINLGYNYTSNGTLTLSSTDDSGIIFAGASSYTKTSGEEVEGITGFSNGSDGKITAKGDLHLYGTDLNSGETGHSALSMTNAGTMTVTGDLDIDSASALSFTNSGTVTAKTFTIGKNLTVANTKTYDTETVTLNGGALSNTGTYTFNAMTLTDGSISGIYNGEDIEEEDPEEEEETVINSNVTVNGMIQLDGDAGFDKELEKETSESTLLTINEEGGFTGDYNLTFTNTNVVNNGTLTDAAAINAKGIKFGAGAVYSYTGSGKNLLSGDLTFDSEAELTVSAANPLYLATGSSLSVGGDEDYGTINFDLTDVGTTPLITLLADGGSAGKAKVYSDIVLTESIKNYVPGSKTITLIQTSNDDSVYDINSISLSDGKSNNTLFVSRQSRVSDDGTSLLLNVNTKGFSDFASTVNQKNAGEYIDNALTDQKLSDDLGDFLTSVMNLDENTDVAVVSDLLDALSGANRANALMLAMTDPWQYSFNQLGWQTHQAYTPKCSSCGSSYRGQMQYYDDGMVYADGEYYDGGYGMYESVFGLEDSTPNSMWAAAHTTSFNARNDGNSGKYGITNTGMSFGYDVVSYSGTKMGIAFDYSQPYLYSTWDRVGEDGTSVSYATQHVDQSNFNLGLYGRRDYWNGFSLTGYIGGGLQNMTSRRRVDVSAISEDIVLNDAAGTGDLYKSQYAGQSLAVALKLARDLDLYNWCVLRPLVQFDMQQVWLSAGEEAGNAIALNYDKSKWNRTMVRAGFETEKNTQFARFTSRFLYGCLLAGDSAPKMTASFAGDGSDNSMTVYGVDLGKNFFDAGLGAIGYLDCDYRWALSGNYDFTVSDKSKAHTGTVALSYSF